ncbi:MAG: cysteine desulfurase family protein [Acidobacteriota bacterium]
MSRIYLDHNAAAPPLAAAVAACRGVAEQGGWGNPHSAHHEGRAARAAMERARDEVAGMVDVPADAVVFTSGGAEGVHMAVMGLARARRAPRRSRLVVSGLEHAATGGAVAALQREGFELTVVPPARDGRVDAGRFLAACDQATAVAVLLAAHNETGVLQPVNEVAAALKDTGTPLVVDAVQAPGRCRQIVPEGAHVVGVLSSHKFGGLAGAGAVIVSPRCLLVPLLADGEGGRRRRAGTPPLALIAAMGAAASSASRRLDAAMTRMRELRDHLESRLLEELPDIEVIGHRAPRLPNTSAVRLAGVVGEDLVAALDLAGVSVSTGAACATGSNRASASLRSMGYPADQAREMVRFSLGPRTRLDEIEAAARLTIGAVKRLRTFQPDGMLVE